jgi:hypothetical protein
MTLAALAILPTLLSLAPDAPRAEALAPTLLSSSSLPAPLVEARKLADQLRYEEAVVEYQKYLVLAERPIAERASALMELGFIHLVLGDVANAETRTLEGLELDARLDVPPSAAPKQRDFLTLMRKRSAARTRLEVLPRRPEDAPALVRVQLSDPDAKAARLLLRHAALAAGPYLALTLLCHERTCTGAMPPPRDSSSYTAWYFVEALDASGNSVARAGSPEAPFQLAVVNPRPWYTSPVVWGVSGAALVGIATVVYFLAPAPPK